MAKVLRYHKGSDIYGWDVSKQLNSNDISQIEDPNGASVEREITSIPSPFARIDLVNTAFKEVANSNPDGKTIYHKMVSDALDVGQILFEIDKYSNDIEIIPWNPQRELQHLLNSPNPGNKALGESLNLFWEQDADQYNFKKIHSLYLINYKRGPNELNIIGGTSPVSLFFTSANKFTLNEYFRDGQHQFFGENYSPLHKRNPEYVKYLFSLKKTIPDFPKGFKNFHDYLEQTRPRLSQELRNEIDQMDVNYYNNLPNLDIGGGGQYAEIFGCNLKKAGKNTEHIRNSGFVLNSEKNKNRENPVLVLPNDFINDQIRYVIDNWDSNNKAPSYDPNPIEDRILPFDGSQYPYLTISDFLEPVLIRSKLPLSSEYFKTYLNNENGYLLPLKPLFFDYFSIADLNNNRVSFKMEELAGGSITVTLRLPVQNGKFVVFKRNYFKPVNSQTEPDYDEGKNNGAIVENTINLGITPFYKFPVNIQPEYNLAFYNLKSPNPLFGSIHFDLDFYNSENKILEHRDIVQKNQIRFMNEEGIDGFSYVIQKNFDYVQIKHNYATGILIPKFNKEITNGVEQFTFGIDFGTSNTHIEFLGGDNGNVTQPLSFDNSENEKYHLGFLIDINEHGAQNPFIKLVKSDLIPSQIKEDSDYEFPQRTAMAHHQKLNFDQPIFSMGNSAIPFYYEKESYSQFVKITTNLKWDLSDESRKLMYSFFEELIKKIRDKILLNNGNINTAKIVWSYPASMPNFQLIPLEEKLNKAIEKYLGNEASKIKICESLTPFIHYVKEQGAGDLTKPVISVDIGGGTSDVAIYKGENPILFTSYRFAADSIFGDNYNRTITINGFVKKFKEIIIPKIDNNNLDNLKTVLNEIEKRNNSMDYINALFSIENNPEVRRRNINISLLEELKNANEFKIIFLLFYTAQIYHIALIFKAKIYDPPSKIAFSGTASKLLNIIDASQDKKLLAKLAKIIFEITIEKPISNFQILMEANPKELGAKGAVHYADMEEIVLDDIKEVLLDKETLLSENNTFDYSSKSEFEKSALRDYSNFLQLFILLDEKISFSENFGIDKTMLNKTDLFLKGEMENAMKQGIENRLNPGLTEDDKITETFFFYPLTGSLGALAYEIIKNNL